MAFTGLLPARKDDTLTVGVSHSGISHAASGLDRDTASETGTVYPIRRGETIFEVDYNFVAAQRWNIQPDVQYIVHPGGGAADDATGQAISNAFVVGVRSTIDF
nr:carbohydrate porin [Mesorhizobium sangaii]